MSASATGSVRSGNSKCNSRDVGSILLESALAQTHQNSLTMQKQRAVPSTSAPERESDSDDVQDNAETPLRGLSPDSDSSDEDSSVDDKMDGNAVDIARLPTVARDDLSVKRRLAKAQKQRASILRSCMPHILIDFMQAVERGVVYLGRIAHGFYEEEMKGYFSQFGEVTRVRLSRSKKASAMSVIIGFILILFVINRPVALNITASSNSHHMPSRKSCARL